MMHRERGEHPPAFGKDRRAPSLPVHAQDQPLGGGRMKLSRIIPLSVIVTATSLYAIKPNPLVSRFKPIYSSFSGSPAALVNGKFGETAWVIKDSSWVAIKLEQGFSRVFFAWNATNYMWSDSLASPGECTEGLPVPESYLLLLSGNSTNGIDGTWKTADSVTSNSVAARGHTIDFTGFSWIKMLVISGSGKIDEIEVYDMSGGGNDTWLFAGTEITADAFKNPVPFKHFGGFVAEYVKDFSPGATPAIIRGGIRCIRSEGLAADIGDYLKMAGSVGCLAIEVGLNDARGGSADNVKSFSASLQRCIDVCKTNKVRPIIARIPATDPEKASWQVNEAYLKAVDELTAKNGLTPGPDLYSWFIQHPEELKDDGIHPSSRGCASIQRLWAEAVYKLYDERETKESPKPR